MASNQKNVFFLRALLGDIQFLLAAALPSCALPGDICFSVLATVMPI
jgi:hypothetical protein